VQLYPGKPTKKWKKRWQRCPRLTPLIFQVDDLPAFIVSSTNYGDGGYPVAVESGGKVKVSSFGVDAGLFSIIPISVLSRLDPTGTNKDENWVTLHHSTKSKTTWSPGPITTDFSLGSIKKIISETCGDLVLTDENNTTIEILTSDAASKYDEAESKE
jgi:hypothetical protein